MTTKQTANAPNTKIQIEGIPTRYKQKKDRLKNLSLKNISCNFLLYIDYFFNFRSMLLDGILYP